MKRVVLFRNGCQTDGKLVLVSHSIDEVLAIASKKFNFTAKKLFTAQGGEVDDIKLLRDDDVLYVTGDEPFISVDVVNTNRAPATVLRDTPLPKISTPVAGPSRAPYPNHLCSAQLFSQRQTCVLLRKISSEEDEPPEELTPVDPPPDQPKLQDWVKLNVGGQYFCTSRSTLVSKEPSSMLARMFNNTMLPSNVDETGAFLIDRSPTYFEPILNYLRNGQLIFDSNINPEGLLEEARFFGIDRLVGHLEHLIANQQRSQDLLPLSRRDVINALIITPCTTELRFQGVNLAGSDLSRLDLRHINFKYACLHGCRMVGANLSWCILERADLSHAVMENAQLIGVKMLCANLEGANMRGCNFEDPGGQRTNMEGVNLKGANLECSNMAGVNLRVATLKNANLQNCDLRAAVFAGADLEKCDLSGSDLHEANLRGANLKDAAFELMVTPLHMAQAVR